MLPARRPRRVLREFEYEIEHLSDVFGKIGDVFVERTVIDGKELDLVCPRAERIGRSEADLVQIFCRALTARAGSAARR